MKEKVFVFNIDGTIADCTHRLHLIQGDNKDYDKFYDECVNDKGIYGVLNILLSLQSQYKIIFITGRPKKSRELTSKWLEEKHWMLLFGTELFMRADGDHRPDYVIKKEIYEKEIKDKYEVIAVFEGRQQCVDMWRELGLTCLQVAKGDY